MNGGRRDDTNLDLFASVVFLAEAARGDQSMAASRLAIARELALVEITDEALLLARAPADLELQTHRERGEHPARQCGGSKPRL